MNRPAFRKLVFFRSLGALTLAASLAWPGQAAAPAPASPRTTNSFVRFERTGTDRGRLLTAVRIYTNANHQSVALIAAIHVGDAAYYRKLQELFRGYEALLYEMIRDRGADATEKIQSDHPVSQLQIGLKSALGLEFQLEALDYTPTNFVHADLDPDTFARLQGEKGESILGLMLRTMLEEEARQRSGRGQTLGPIQLLFALASGDRAHALKLLLAQQMDQIEATLAGIDRGSDGQGSVLVSGRNEHAISVLREQLQRGKRRLGIFYGAGHMPDFDRRLRLLGFEPASEQWLTAWDLRRKRSTRAPKSGPSTNVPGSPALP
jgi:hypothetical protein